MKEPPDLVVESISPGDQIVDFEAKLKEYREGRIPLVWVINASARHADLYIDGRFTRRLEPDAELTCEDLPPGFRLALADLFAILDE